MRVVVHETSHILGVVQSHGHWRIINLFVHQLFQNAATIEQFYWLSAITAGVGLLSFILQYLLTKPLEKSIARITQQTIRIAEGDFHTEVPLIGTQEFKLLAQQFNEMSSKLKESFDHLHHSETARRELIANVSHDLRTPWHPFSHS